jgi:hypothetical protein
LRFPLCYVRANNPKPKIRTWRRVEIPPGAQMQTNWAEYPTMDVGEGPEPLQAFVMVLSHSRKTAIVWNRDQTLLSSLCGHNEVYRRFDAVAAVNRPHVSDDNPYSESLFRTLKYRPEYPRGAFASVEAARWWVKDFVRWYDTEHLHSAIGLVAPEDRHTGRDKAILAARRRTYEAARNRNPERWAGNTRNWERVEVLKLDPEPEKSVA